MSVKNRHGGPRPNSGPKPKPPEERSTSVHVRVPPDALQKLDALAKAQGKSRSATIVALIRALIVDKTDEGQNEDCAQRS